ncbi:MAG: helix-turn-helix domain-containing protein [Leptospirales bacterium]|nr:helix-turn-helix domain-containing protein [Leptospirales bacterium]
MPKIEDRKLALYARALGHPIRIRVARLLAETAGCYAGSLADRLPVAASTLSQHLKVLLKAGLIKACNEPPRIKYCINGDCWRDAEQLFAKFYAGPGQRMTARNRRRS